MECSRSNKARNTASPPVRFNVMLYEGVAMQLRIIFSAITLGLLAATSTAGELAELYKTVKSSVLRLEEKDPFGNTRNIGTGFYIGNGCYIATNYHVIKGNSQIAVISDEEVELEKLDRLKVDKDYDLAIIPVSQCGSALELSGSLPEIGQEIITVGNPRGLDKTLSNGVISGIREGDYKVIQITAAISPGSSGGPLVDMSGVVVGMTTFYLEESQSLNFAVPSSALIKLLASSSYISADDIAIAIRKDAMSVASSFFWAIHKKDIESAISFVHPSEQLEFERHFRSDLPSIPSDASFEIAQGAPINGNEHTEVSIKGTKIGIDLVRYRNGWWVIK